MSLNPFFQDLNLYTNSVKRVGNKEIKQLKKFTLLKTKVTYY